MKIVMIFDGLQVGGAERVGADYARILGELGHEVTIVNLNPSLTEMEPEFVGCRILHFKYPRKFAPEQYAQIIKWGGIFKIVYPLISYTLDFFNIFYKIYFRLRKGVNGKYDLCIAFAGHFNDLTFVNKNYINSKKKMCWLHGALYSYLLISDGYLILYKKIKNLVVLVDDGQEEVLCYNKRLNLNINKIYNPTYIKSKAINNDYVKELKNKYGNFLVMVSRFDFPHKDHYTVAKAFEILRTKYKKDFNLLFLGTGPEEENVRDYCKNLVGDTSAHIYFLGNQSNVQDFYSAAFALVHASVAGEGLPTIMLEALSYDLPMVVTDSKTGPREIIKNNEYGLLCRVQDPFDMAYNINLLIEDDNLYTHYKTVGKNRIADFEPEVIKNTLENVLLNIMKE